MEEEKGSPQIKNEKQKYLTVKEEMPMEKKVYSAPTPINKQLEGYTPNLKRQITSKMTVKDYLFVSDSKALADILNKDEKVMISCEVMEGSLAGKWEKRYLILTSHRLFNLTEDMQPVRIIEIVNISCITKKNDGFDLNNYFDFLIEIDD